MRKLIFLTLLIISSTITQADEMINEMVAMVGDTPITVLDLKDEISHKRPVNVNDQRNLESKILDILIEKAIVDIVIKEEAISISQAQVDDIIQKTMIGNGYKDEKTFEQALNEQMHMSLADYKKEITNNLKIQQIAQLKVSVSAPKDEEIKHWYNQHKNDVGNKYLLRIIKKSFNPNNAKEELSVNQLMNKARNEAVANFTITAKQYSDDPSSTNGGLLGWLRLDELGTIDPMMANVVYQTQAGEVSKVFVSKNNYMIVKIDAISPVSLEEASPLIMQKLYQEKQQAGYFSWIKNRKKSTGIKIYMKGYQGL
ncbi:MAG: peptidylprolyl isomerase [Spirochaetia bacterium]|nr:peptidylprolyl isomerase [Spirochaetia bacterium]